MRASSRFHLAVYTVNPAGPAEDAAPAAERERASATLQWLAAQTGGRAVEAEGLTAGLARLAHDLESYYVLTYQPADADGRFHAVEVRAKRRNAQVRRAPGLLGAARQRMARDGRLGLRDSCRYRDGRFDEAPSSRRGSGSCPTPPAARAWS